jgi:hypothetical protein
MPVPGSRNRKSLALPLPETVISYIVYNRCLLYRLLVVVFVRDFLLGLGLLLCWLFRITIRSLAACFLGFLCGLLSLQLVHHRITGVRSASIGIVIVGFRW